MHASPVSASDNTRPNAALIVSLNWLGDCVMAMPALQSWRRRNPAARLTILSRPATAPLWQMHTATSEVLISSGTALDQLRLSRRLRSEDYEIAYVWPRSFRSALTPWLAGIPSRRGLPGHTRDWIMTEIRPPSKNPAKKHQAFEYLNLMDDESDKIEVPVLNPAPTLLHQWTTYLRNTGIEAWIALLPGAAFGPAKRWPADFFAEAGRKLCKKLNIGAVILGSAAEYAICRDVTDRIGKNAVNLAGQTGLTDLATILAGCRLAITNDSGGMHLAAAANAPVVAVFGITDPEKTGPLGNRVCVLQNSVRRSRDFKHNIKYAAKALASITPEQVEEAALRLADRSRT